MKHIYQLLLAAALSLCATEAMAVTPINNDSIIYVDSLLILQLQNTPHYRKDLCLIATGGAGISDALHTPKSEMNGIAAPSGIVGVHAVGYFHPHVGVGLGLEYARIQLKKPSVALDYAQIPLAMRFRYASPNERCALAAAVGAALVINANTNNLYKDAGAEGHRMLNSAAIAELGMGIPLTMGVDFMLTAYGQMGINAIGYCDDDAIRPWMVGLRAGFSFNVNMLRREKEIRHLEWELEDARMNRDLYAQKLKLNGEGELDVEKKTVPETEIVMADNVVIGEAEPVEEEEVVAEEKVETPSAGRYVTVRPGNSLIRLARKYYDGDGEMWKVIWEANKDKIKNPNLIYPGQVLYLP